MSLPQPPSRLHLPLSSTSTPCKLPITSFSHKPSLDQASLSYSLTNKPHKYLSYDSQPFNPSTKQPNINTIIQQALQPRYEDNQICEDLSRLNSKLEELENCFLNMSTINLMEGKENVRPGMMKKGKGSRQGSKERLGRKRGGSFVGEGSSRRGSFMGTDIREGSKQKQKEKDREITQLKRQVSFCQKSLSASKHKKQLLEKRVDDYSFQIKNYRILQRKAKKLQLDHSKLLHTLQKSQQVRLKQKSLISKYQQQIKRLNKLIKYQR